MHARLYCNPNDREKGLLRGHFHWGKNPEILPAKSNGTGISMPVSRRKLSRGYEVVHWRNLELRFQALSNTDEQDIEEEDTVNQQWKQVRNMFDEASKTCLGM